MSVDVNLIKQLREKTGAGIADCREALEATSNDLKKAEDYIKKKGIARAERLIPGIEKRKKMDAARKAMDQVHGRQLFVRFARELNDQNGAAVEILEDSSNPFLRLELHIAPRSRNDFFAGRSTENKRI